MQRTSILLAILAAVTLLTTSGCEAIFPDTPTCDAVPTCPAGTEKVTECPDGRECTRNNTCGGTAICLVHDDTGTADVNDSE